MCGTTVESLRVYPSQDRTFAAFPDREVDRARSTWDQRDGSGFVALADDAQGSVSAFEREVLDVGGAGFADPEAVQAQEHRERGVVVVEAFGGEQERAEFSAVQPASLARMDPRSADVLGRFLAIRPSMCAYR